MENNIFDSLDTCSLAAVLSIFTYEGRGPTRYLPAFPNSDLARLYSRVAHLWDDLVAEEAAMSIPLTREVDPGFMEMAYMWAKGESFDSVLSTGQMSPGDFVRNIKQLIDLARQIALLAPNPETADNANSVVSALLRGVVEASSVVGIDMESELGD
jgi:ATP-dependent RNA helicase HelY